MAIGARIAGRAKRLAGRATGNRRLERRGRKQERRARRHTRRNKRLRKVAAAGGLIALARRRKTARPKRTVRRGKEVVPARLVRRTVTTVDTYDVVDESNGKDGR